MLGKTAVVCDPEDFLYSYDHCCDYHCAWNAYCILHTTSITTTPAATTITPRTATHHHYSYLVIAASALHQTDAGLRLLAGIAGAFQAMDQDLSLPQSLPLGYVPKP